MKRRNLLQSLATLAAGSLTGTAAAEDGQATASSRRRAPVLVHYVGIDRAEVAAHLTAQDAEGRATLCYERRPAQRRDKTRIEFWETVQDSHYLARESGVPVVGSWHYPTDPETGEVCSCARAYGDKAYGRKKKPPVFFAPKLETEEMAVIRTHVDAEGIAHAEFPDFSKFKRQYEPKPARVESAEAYLQRRERLKEAWAVIERDGGES